MFKLLLPCAAVALLAGCASGTSSMVKQTSPAIDAPQDSSFQLEYRGGVGESSRAVLQDMARFTSFDNRLDAKAFTVEVRMVSLSRRSGEKLLGQSANGVGVTSLDGAQSSDLLAMLAESPDAIVLSSPRLTVMEGQTGTIEISTEVSYVSGFDLVPAPGERDAKTLIADPVIGVVKDGIVIALKVERGGDKYNLELDVGVSALQRPIGTSEVHVLGAPMTVQVPVMVTQRLKGSGLVVPDRTIVLTGLAGEEGDMVLLLVKARETDLTTAPDDTHEPQDD